MIARLLGLNPFLIGGSAVLLVTIGILYWVIGERNQTITVLELRNKVVQSELALQRANTFSLEASLISQNEMIDDLAVQRDNLHHFHKEVKDQLDRAKWNHRKELMNLRDEKGSTCKEGVSLIDRELDL